MVAAADVSPLEELSDEEELEVEEEDDSVEPTFSVGTVELGELTLLPVERRPRNCGAIRAEKRSATIAPETRIVRSSDPLVTGTVLISWIAGRATAFLPAKANQP